MEQLFVPQKPPEDQEQFNEYAWRMFRDIAQNIETIADGRNIEKRHVAPTKPRDGMAVYADGTNWNPGSGEGFYLRINGIWEPVIVDTSLLAPLNNPAFTGSSSSFANGLSINGGVLSMGANGVEGGEIVLDKGSTENWDKHIDSQGDRIRFFSNALLNFSIADTGLCTVRNGLTVSAGNITVSTGNITVAASATVDGRDVSADGTKLDGIETGAEVNTIVQVVNVMDSAVATGTNIIPDDDTIPQNTEGTEFMTLAITPASASNKLKIDVVVSMATTDGTGPIKNCVALFQDSTANALAAVVDVNERANVENNLKFTHYMTSGTASSTTFKVRASAGNSGTYSFNGTAGSRKMGGVMASSITITEIAV